MVSIRLFGGASLEGEDGALTGPAAQRHRVALLALLAVSRSRAPTRDKLMALLWPDRDADHARALLNQSVYVLRKALGEDAIVSSGEDLRLDTDRINCDVAEFEESLEAGDLARSVELYTGPFLDGFGLSGAAEFEHWVDGERARLADARGRALEALAEAAEERGDMPAAVAWWKDRAAHDPYDSRVTLRLMEALVRAGNPAGAIQQASAHERRLREELELEPPADIASLAERLRREPPPLVARGATDEEEASESPAGSRDSTQVSTVPTPVTAGADTSTQKEHKRGRARSPVRYATAALLVVAAVIVATQVGSRSPDAAFPDPAPGASVDEIGDEELLGELRRRMDGDARDNPQAATTSPLARDLYRRCSDPSVLRSDSAARRALTDCEQAVAHDSMYAPAWSMLARLYIRTSNQPEKDRSLAERLAEAGTAARRALQLDSSLAEPHAVLGALHRMNHEFDAAVAIMARAVELDPNSSLLQQWLVVPYLWTGQPAEALRAGERAVALDPSDPRAIAEYARALVFNGRCDEALELIDEKRLEALPEPLLRVPGLVAVCQGWDGRWADAARTLRSLLDRDWSATTLGLLGYALARAGRPDSARGLAAELGQRWQSTGMGAVPLALVHAGLGDIDHAFGWLDRVEPGSDGAFENSVLVWRLMLDALREDPRLEGVRKRLRLPAL